MVAGHLSTFRAASGTWRLQHSCSTEAALRLMKRIMVTGHLFSSRAAAGIWRLQHSCWTEAALRLMRRMMVAGHLFTSRAAAGIWRSRGSYSTEAALRLMRRIVLATHLLTSRARGISRGIWRSRPSCWTAAAHFLARATGYASTLEESRSFCRTDPQAVLRCIFEVAGQANNRGSERLPHPRYPPTTKNSTSPQLKQGAEGTKIKVPQCSSDDEFSKRSRDLLARCGGPAACAPPGAEASSWRGAKVDISFSVGESKTIKMEKKKNERQSKNPLV